jgi:NAD(P)-dependent dehydrogenase (short-subunit alcohol dehydrogenase family)
MAGSSTDYRKLFQLDGKVALVTGGGRGIGAEACRALSSAGAAVLVTDVLENEGLGVAEELRARGGKAEFLKQDVTVEGQWEETVAAAVQKFGRLDVLVNNAGIEKMAFITDTTREEFQRILDVNVTGVFLGCKYAVRAMRPGGIAGHGGSIINLSSIAGLVGVTALGAYNASKGAVRLLTKSVAVECGQLKTGVRCNSIHPGLIKTNMGDHFLQNFVDLGLVATIKDSENAFLRAVPLGDWGAPQDIAAAMVYLASDASRYVTGAELHVDGGFFAT